jgi:serine/threonine protein kinase
MARQLGEDMTIVGTDAYMAPELMFDDPYDTAADMFSFGIVVWECIHRKKAGADGFAERRPSDRFVLDQVHTWWAFPPLGLSELTCTRLCHPSSLPQRMSLRTELLRIRQTL